ncbi:MAG TPA: diadenylate cyclase [Candidatus Nanoarchaeia archaeon]|nr:diadenylate cyclase [Candidatus Nanoarchaeia archaeon]
MVYTKEGQISSILGVAATKIANEINANSIISVERTASDIYNDSSPYYDVKVSIFKKINISQYAKAEYKTKIKKPEPGSIVPLREILMDAISNKYIAKGEKVVCIQDESVSTGYKGMLFIFDVNNLFFDISANNLAENINSNVIETVIDIALELSKYGREGKKVGTAFVIGNRENILKYSKQMIINPFANLEDDKKRIIDTNLRETIKEFSQLDGVFLVDNEGVILSSGTYLDVDTEGLDLPQGLGTRHRNCAAITAKTDAIAVVVSASGGKVKVFKNGRIVMTI